MATAPSFIANFDSTSAMVRALGAFLNGRDFPGTGIHPNRRLPLGILLNHMPNKIKEQVYIWAGWAEAIPPRQLSKVRAERFSEWVVSEYPKRKYPAIAVGSSGGAMIHLCAALQIPWLPQTFLIPVARSGVHPDEPADDLEFGKEPARDLLEANPDLQLHHMNDANQDRLMIQRMTYFRVKRLWLGEAYERFIRENLEPGGTIFINECTLKWPSLKVRDRHYFQHGALGGATPKEFHEGSERVEEYLARYGSPHRRWPSPPRDTESPEAEWGFEYALRDDIIRLADQQGYRVRRIVHEEPEHLSPLVADLHRDWYRQRGIDSKRLIVGSFIVFEPWWTLKTGSLPFWLTFNKLPSADVLEEYIEHAGPFDEIYIMLFSHGVDSVGLVPIDKWRQILSRARKQGRFIGVDEEAYPRDFAVFVRYNVEIKKLAPRYPMPGPLTLGQLDEFLAENEGRYAAAFLDDLERPAPSQHEMGPLPQTTALERG